MGYALVKCLLCENLITSKARLGMCHECQSRMRKMTPKARNEMLRAATEKKEKRKP